jgi:hypothetical protein
MTMIAERCPVCGTPIDPAADDTVQVHGGERGLVHEQCLLEYEDDGPEAA